MSFGPTRSNRGAGNFGEQLVQFKLSDAERIASVVSTVEKSRRGRTPSHLPRAAGGGGGGIRLVTFTGSWPIGSSKNVTFDASTDTASVVNLFHNIGVDCGTRKAAIAKNGTAWMLLVPQCG